MKRFWSAFAAGGAPSLSDSFSSTFAFKAFSKLNCLYIIARPPKESQAFSRLFFAAESDEFAHPRALRLLDKVVEKAMRRSRRRQSPEALAAAAFTAVGGIKLASWT
jgi:hypothetical protein